MTIQIIRRCASVLTVLLIALAITAGKPTDAAARKHKAASAKKTHGKIAHNGRKSKHDRYARLSRHGRKAHAVSVALSTKEKDEIVQKIRDLAKATPGGDSLMVGSADVQSQIAEAAREEQAEDDVNVSIEQFFKERGQSPLEPTVPVERTQDFTLYDQTDPTRAAQRSDIMAEIIDWMGTRYVFGGLDRSGIDCSAFTREVFQKSFGVELPRTAYMQYQLGEPVDKNDLKFGDLVFFHTAGYAPITHVGIYIGEGLFANAACSKGVTVGSLTSTYWSKHYAGAKRLFANSGLASRQAPSTDGMALSEGQ
jgi:cell wall-associated NlpC family hydrolase